MAERGARWRDPATALIAALAAVPLSWVFGVEQFVPPLLLIVAAVAYWLRERPPLAIEARLLLVFLVVALGSAGALADRADLILWLRGLFNLTAGVAALVLASSVDPRGPGPARLARAAAVGTLGIALLGALVCGGWVKGAFEVPLPGLFPEWARTGFVEDYLMNRRMIVMYRRPLIPSVPRFSGFFLFQGGLGTALLVTQTWILLGRDRLPRRWRWWGVAALAGGACALVLTGSRSAILVGFFALALVALWRSLAGSRWQRAAVRAVIAAVLAAAVTIVVPLPGGAIWERLFIDFRIDSFIDRVDTYRNTLRAVGERPLFGFGIQERPAVSRDFLRLGTHSEPLNVLYRFGWLGGGLYLLAVAALAVAFVRRLLAAARRGGRELDDLVVLAAGLAALAANSLFRDLQFDATVYWLCAALVGTARAYVAAPAGAAAAGPAPEELRLLGVRVHPLTVGDLHARIAADVAAGRRTVIGHHNLHSVYLAHHDPAMAEFDRRADRLFVDGMGLVAMARLLGHPLTRRHRITYADWIHRLAAEAAARGWRLFHVGGAPGVGERAAARLAAAHPGLAIASRPGYFDATAGGPESEAVLAEIRAARPHVLLVGMGMPRQERWVVENLDRIDANVILTAGACMAYVAGATPTPPRWAGRLGLEWLFRLAAEPRRLGRRYLVEPWYLLRLAAVEATRRRRAR